MKGKKSFVIGKILSSFLFFAKVFAEHKKMWRPDMTQHWSDKETCRKFLDKWAKSQSFNPLIPENWYPILGRELLQSVCFLARILPTNGLAGRSGNFSSVQ